MCCTHRDKGLGPKNKEYIQKIRRKLAKKNRIMNNNGNVHYFAIAQMLIITIVNVGAIVMKTPNDNGSNSQTS